MDLERFLESNEWQLVDRLETESRDKEVYSCQDLSLSGKVHAYIQKKYPEGLFHHQREGIVKFLNGENVCLTTSTASGKSDVFFLAATEVLRKDPDAKILCIYPLRALGREQQDRWRILFDDLGLDIQVGRVDGSVKPLTRRPGILRDSQVVVCTPDIIHAWLFSNLTNREVQSFLRHIKLVVVDEVHTYTGVFGSNAAFLFRRLQHILGLLQSSPQFICTSATIAKPFDHLVKLFGIEFHLVDQTQDTSPAYGHDIFLVNPPGMSDFLSEVVKLLRYLSLQTDKRFITFVDSRKQVELISSILARGRRKGNDRKIEVDEDDDEESFPEARRFSTEILDELEVLPYRAGFEESDRRHIQERLTSGSLSGVVSTSALELGIDIAHLDICVLIGVPSSQTSLHQRIGRVGRKKRGTVIVINTGTVQDEAVFREPKRFLERPLAEGALYLENEYIQYIHGLCLARLDGEHDAIATALNLDRRIDFGSEVVWPLGFIDLCNQERTGQIPKTFQIMKAEAGESPNYTYPLRDVGSQFKVQIKRMNEVESRGSLSFSQLMREAYPAAVYYYATVPYRVYRVRVRSREVDIRNERHYITRPLSLPALVFPNLTEENVHRASLQDELLQIECDLQIRESISGFKERRGPNEFTQEYPVPIDLNIYFDQRYFTRTYFSTGVVISHPVLDKEGVNTGLLAELIYEAFLLCIPFERQDINFTSDRFRTGREPLISVEDRFIAIFDQTYGSLRLTGRLMDEGILTEVLEVAKELAVTPEIGEISSETIKALDELLASSKKSSSEVVFTTESSEFAPDKEAQYEKVILPGSKGLNLNRDNEEFFVDRVFLTRDGLRYEGITETHIGHLEKTSCMAFASDIVEIPGVSKLGLYNYETGNIEDIEPRMEIKVSPIYDEVDERRVVDSEKLRFVLSKHFSANEIMQLCTKLNLDVDIVPGETPDEIAEKVVKVCDQIGKTRDLLNAASNHAKECE
jgi:DEAD/DEAH box helicase domain-containing protein